MDSKVEKWCLKAASLAAKAEGEGENPDCTNEAIVLGREALEIYLPTHPIRASSLSWLALHLWDRFKQLEMEVDLDEAIDLEREALELRPPGHADRSGTLVELACRLSVRHRLLEKREDLEEATVLGREALTLLLPDDPTRWMVLYSHAEDLCSRFELCGELEDLEKAIMLDREVLELGAQENALCMSLATHLYARHDQLGKMEDLDEAISLGRKALAGYPTGHKRRPAALSNHAGALVAWYKQLGGMEYLDEAIALTREALECYEPGDNRRPLSLNNLALSLLYRYRQLGEPIDLDEAITLGREALAHCSSTARPMCMGNLAMYLEERNEQLGTKEDLDEAIALGREAVALQPPGYPGRSFSLGNLASHICKRYKRRGAVEDLDEAIRLDQDALVLRPPGHPYRSTSLTCLANHLFSRFELLGKVDVLNDAIVLYREALGLHPLGHPERNSAVAHLAVPLFIRFKRLGQLVDKEEMFSVFAELAYVPQMVSSTALSAVRVWITASEQFQRSTTLLSYDTVFRSLDRHLATLPSLSDRLGVVELRHASLGVNAFSAGLRHGSPNRGIELLEQGRGVILNRLVRFRSPLDDVVASGAAGKELADKFMQSASAIRCALHSPDGNRHARVYRLDLELQTVVNDIRYLPGLSRFLLPSPFSDLRQAAIGGPVIIVNESKYGCDALVVLVDRDPVHIHLQITKERVRGLSSNFHVLTRRAMRADIAKDLAFCLRELWEMVVSPIVDFLRTIHPPPSRIWWCPTGEFSLLPFHAAGPYRKGQKNLIELYVPSYTPTLTALVRARRPMPLNHLMEQKRFVAVGQAKAINQKELQSVGMELADIGRRVERLPTFTRIEGSDSTVSHVAEEIGKADWVHFACHGLPNRKEPFQSAFALYDGELTIKHIIQCQLENAEFAYLSACHTTVGDEESPDEMIHLASAMQFAGFRSVIGTMWAVDDGVTTKITSMFYDNMVDV